MSPRFNVHHSIQCLLCVEKFDESEVKWSSGWFSNLILDSGLNELASSMLGHVNYCNIGTGSSTPSVGQTGLDSFYDSVGGWIDEMDEISSDPQVLEKTRSYTFSIGSFSGENITELGLSWGSNGTYFNRQLIRQLVGVTDESITTGDGSTKNFTHTYSTPLEPETISITDGTQVITDDGHGNLTGDIDSGGINTIDYDNGDADFTFASAPADSSSITTDYEWWESTSVTVLSEEGLKVYVKLRLYPWFGEASSYAVTGSFSFDDQVDGTTDTIDYSITQTKMANSVGRFLNGTVISWNGVGCNSQDETSSFTSVSSGGPKVIITMGCSPPGGEGDLTSIDFQVSRTGTDYYAEFDINIAFTPSIYKREQDQLEFTLEITWGRYYGTS